MTTLHKNTVHGHTAGGKMSPTYRSWVCMWDRCTNPKNSNYPRYGGAGITIAPRWEDFKEFLLDMGERPDGLTLDRVDNGLGYCKANCRWATRAEQSQNRRNTRWVTIAGVTRMFTEWCALSGVTKASVYDRIERGWSLEDALTRPPQPRGRKPASGVRATKPAPPVDCRGNRRPRPRMTAKEFRAHQAARLATRIAERKGIEVTW